MMENRDLSPVALIAGFTLWLVAFGAIYGLQSVGCAFGWHQVMVGPVHLNRAFLIMLFFVTIALGWFVIACARRRVARAGDRPHAFLEKIGLYGGWAALVSSLVTYGPVFFLSTCV
jgi:hypothetical protein